MEEAGTQVGGSAAAGGGGEVVATVTTLGSVPSLLTMAEVTVEGGGVPDTAAAAMASIVLLCLSM